MTQAQGFSLWLVPEERVFGDLRRLIDELAAHYGTKPFEPHVTVLGEFDGPEPELVEKCRVLAEDASAFSMRFEKASHGDAFFRCVYLPAVVSEPLNRLHEGSRMLFYRPVEKFTPHLSLVYGHLPSAVRTEITALTSEHLPISFRADRLRLMRTKGGIDEWKLVREFPVRNGS